MIHLSIHLPTRHRIDISLVKKRKNLEETPLLPNLGSVLRTRKGNKFSRYFRHVFENKKIKRFFGTNLAIIAFATSLTSFNINNHAVLASDEVVTFSSPLILRTKKGLQYPLENVHITQAYSFFHQGIDLDGITGDPVKPIAKGVVKEIGHSRFGYGNSILIKHDGGVYSFYAHLSKINVRLGDEVDLDSIIGNVGSSGRAFGDHLHLEVIEIEKRINPLNFLADN
jgi:murein DD-endopeptidase MepM/ murein hydrolase activator NlpD